jgi:hypothetical protein
MIVRTRQAGYALAQAFDAMVGSLGLYCEA